MQKRRTLNRNFFIDEIDCCVSLENKNVMV
jgi:hypothetical protein